MSEVLERAADGASAVARKTIMKPIADALNHSRLVIHHDEPQMELKEEILPPIDCHLEKPLYGTSPALWSLEEWKANNLLREAEGKQRLIGFNGEMKPLRGYTSAERKEAPVQTVMAEYFPDALVAVSRVAKAGNDKHNPGEPLHWAREKSSDHLNCAVRHLMTPDSLDPDTGGIELANAAWRVLAALQLREEKRLVAAGIRPLSGIVPAVARDEAAGPLDD